MEFSKIDAFLVETTSDAINAVKDKLEWSSNPSNNKEVIIEVNEENERDVAGILDIDVDEIPHGLFVLYVG